MNATKNGNIEMVIEVVNGAESTQQLLDAVEAIRPAAKVAAYRGEDNIATIKRIICAIESKHRELLPDIFDATEDDLTLITELQMLRDTM